MTAGDWGLIAFAVVYGIWFVVTLLWGPSPITTYRLRREWWSRCPHMDIRGISGGEIEQAGGYRLQCATCRRYLRGPVTFANYPRKAE